MGNYSHALLFDNFLSKEECEQLLASYANNMKIAGVGKGNVSKNIRSAKAVTIKKTEPIVSKVIDFCLEKNQDNWNFDIHDIRGFQLIRYDEGDHYDWHLDIGKGKSHFRKLSFVVLLSDPSTYEGGDLVLRPGHEEKSIPFSVGDLVIFPSFILHKVEPVIQGFRYVLVGWLVGNRPFR